MSGTGPRPWLAGLLALIYPGLGHVYVRAWGRALLWFALAIATTLFVVPEEVAETTKPFADPMAASEAIVAQTPTLGVVSILLVIAFSMIDAYLMARRAGDTTTSEDTTAETDTTHTCPECGREVDPELSFCHWCSTELPDDAESEMKSRGSSILDRLR